MIKKGVPLLDISSVRKIRYFSKSQVLEKFRRIFLNAVVEGTNDFNFMTEIFLYLNISSNGMLDRTKAWLKSLKEKVAATTKPVSEPALVPVTVKLETEL